MAASIQWFRMMKIVEEIRRNRFPDVNRLHDMLCEERKIERVDCVCSHRTIMRDINKLREVFSAPIGYNEIRKGYYLWNRKWKLDISSGKFKLLNGTTDKPGTGKKKSAADNEYVFLRAKGNAADHFRLHGSGEGVEITFDDNTMCSVRIRSMTDSDVINFVLSKAGEVELVRPARLRTAISTIAHQIANRHEGQEERQ